MASIKGNIILNGLNTATSILVPLVTFPYAARVLMPEGIGAVNFQLSVINYIVLLTSIGIPLYAVKEVARHRDNIELRNKITIEILMLSAGLCILGYIGVWLLATYVPQIHEQIKLFYILSLTILFNAIGVEWFYKGIENFKYITIRAIIVRVAAAICLFVFVKNQSDLLIYGCIVVASTVGNNLINFFHLRKYFGFSDLSLNTLDVMKHLKPALHVFLLNVIISLYVQLNTLMLGFMAGDEAVGFFTAGTKISYTGQMFIASLSVVLLPRCSNLLEKGDLKGFAEIIKKSAKLTVSIALPEIIGLIILAQPITLIFCGPEYLNSITVLRLNAPVILLVGITNVLSMQILYPMNKINTVILSVSGGAIINILLNIILIPSYGATGAAISTLFTEFVVLAILIVAGRKYFPFKWNEIFTFNYISASLLMGVVVLLVYKSLDNIWLQFSFGLVAGIITYAATLYIAKETLFMGMLHFLLRKNNATKSDGPCNKITDNTTPPRL